MSAGSRKRLQGFTYIGLLIFLAVMGAGMAAFGELASHAAQREKEAELLFRGEAYRAAIESYYKKEQRYPQSLEQLLEDKRYPTPVRHLRRLYADPLTGEADWAVVEAPGGGIMGVHSRSEEAPVKTGNFSLKNQLFAEAKTYAEWNFVHSPTGLAQRVEKSPAK
jgi:type II secretory pathway pseudopilin PulG